MKRPRSVILFIIIALIVLPVAALGAYLTCMPSGMDVITILARTHILYRDGWSSARLEPEDKRIDVTQPTDGLVLEYDGYSVTVSGYTSAQSIDEIWGGQASYCKLDEKKGITLYEKRPMGYANNKSIEEMQEQLELASGMVINTEFDFRLALFSISVKDFTLSNDRKDHALAKSLAHKGSATVWGCTDLYYIENDRIKAVEMRYDSDNIKLEFCKKDDPNSIYWIYFMGLTMEETDSIISTIQFN